MKITQPTLDLDGPLSAPEVVHYIEPDMGTTCGLVMLELPRTSPKCWTMRREDVTCPACRELPTEVAA